MKRGFLNTEKAKHQLAAGTNVPNYSDHPLDNDKGKAKAET